MTTNDDIRELRSDIKELIKAVAAIGTKIDDCATSADVSQAIETHRQGCSRVTRREPSGGRAALLRAIAQVLTVIAAAIGAALGLSNLN